MSTFKIQPVYAELMMGWLSCAEKEVGGITWNHVLSNVAWRFKGGAMGGYKMTHRTPCSDTYFPDGTTMALAAQGEWGRDRMALRRVVRAQMAEKRRARSAQAAWVASYAAVDAMRRDTRGSGQVRTGLSAVYMVLGHLWMTASPANRLDSRLFKYIREMSVMSAMASHLDPETVEALVKDTQNALATTPMGDLRDWVADMTKITRYAMSRMASRTSRSRGTAIIDGPLEDTEIGDLGCRRYKLGGILVRVMSGCAVLLVAGQVVALSISDMQRMRAFLTGAASGLFATVSQACVAPGPERRMAAKIGACYIAQVDRLLTSARRMPLGDEVKVCKGFKRAFGAYLGEISGPLCAAETKALWAEAEETTARGEIDVKGWVAEIRKWTAPTAFNLGKVYKLCPAPDASPGGTMLERHEMISNRNLMSDTVVAQFTDELRSQILRAHIRTPGVKLEPRDKQPPWWDSYLHRQFDSVPSDEIHKWLKWEGTAVMPSRSPDDPTVWKDSGLGYDTMDMGMDPDRDRLMGNMLTRMVFDKALPMPGKRHVGHAHVHKVDIKPEGHKDPARAIYSGNLRDRLNQSWMEQAVENVAVNHPAFMIAAGPEAREERARMIVDRPVALDDVALYYSFDIAKWSPWMPPEPQRISHGIWGELYGEEMFGRAHEINEGSTVYMNKGGYQAWYINNGVNFEGYNGKEMTMILITLMSLSVKVWREKMVGAKLCTAAEAKKLSVGLMAYIDDGLAKTVMKRQRAAEKFHLFKSVCVTVFRLCGYAIEPSKCYPSDRFAIFLNEAYLMGRHVSHGTRAAMTLNAENDEEHTSLPERAMAVAGGCGGAIMAGLDALTGYMLMCYTMHAHLDEWIPHVDPMLAATWCITPHAWGGLGLPSIMQLGTSGSGAAFEEGVRNLQRAATKSRVARMVFLRRARGGLATRDSSSVMAAPLGGEVAVGMMTQSRTAAAVSKALENLHRKGVLSPIARTFWTYGDRSRYKCFAESVIPQGPGAVIQEQLILDLASVHPDALFQAFARRLEKSSTLFRLAGAREMYRIVKGNKEDVTKSIEFLSILTRI